MRILILSSILACIAITKLYGQSDSSASVLTAESYFSNPVTYLSTLNKNKIASGILIDRTIYDSLILNVNGTSKITTISSTSWFELYNQIRYSTYDTTTMDNINVFSETVDAYYESSRVYSIGILDFNFNRIRPEAISSGQLIQGINYIKDLSANSSSFFNERAVVASCLSENIQGDRINFVVSDFFYLTNVQSEQLNSIQIDFDDGFGYRTLDFGDVITIDYGSQSEFLLIKVKLTYENIITHVLTSYYAYSSVHRTGSSTVPSPDIVSSGLNNGGRIDPDREFLYPELVTGPVTYCGICGYQVCCRTIETVLSGGDLQVYILFSPENTSQKLRRPFIVTDGFDPGNKRDYYSNKIAESKTPKSNDFRGLYQLLNGDPSPWYENYPSANLIDLLRDDGYDIVIVNFTKGDGDIPSNATMLRNLFKNVLNSSLYRDNKTEEAILVGPSMGGLITRHALTTMEQNNEPHYVKAWYSFDSPHKGAYIPLALQRSVNFLAKIHTGGIGVLEDAKAQFQNSRDILNTEAAKQMLRYHYKNSSSSGQPTDAFTDLQNELDILGFPKQTKNYALSNGGTTKLYEESGALILGFKIFSWTWVVGYGNKNVDGNYKIFEGSRQGSNNDEELYTNNQIGFENSVGGWNSALYSLNYQPKNKWDWATFESEAGLKSTFILTSSAFGIPITRQSVYKTWEDYQASDTPFDVIKGMNITGSEEHVRISPATASWFIDQLRQDFTNSTRPRVRTNQVVTQTITGPVAYVIKEDITFAGSGNSFTVENSGDIKITAGNSITLSPGFFAKAGSVVSTLITPVEYSTINSRMSASSTEPIDFSQQSPYLGEIFDYIEEQPQQVENTESGFVIYPNPVEQTATMILSDYYAHSSMQIVNAIGVIVFTDHDIEAGEYHLDLSDFSTGIYSVIIKRKNAKVITGKILKL